ncbi:tyrosine-type recombinase/integrase [Kocuria turfanensis]|uniref:Phage integrase n=1 Tax=Kocuria turfanensis TaxID=388357 RepID=A0A512IBX9_9MICC|nr:tyrosine-type recombinase/integrase [Kocuria turfanensis]GEO95208.1 phage integrase [Kocuria turfanensis]
MARPRLGIGELGEVAYTQLGHRKVRARARYRDATGTTRQIEATGTSQSAAKRALEQRLKERGAGAGNTITSTTLVRDLLAVWLVDVEQSGRRRPQTLARYKAVAENIVVPGLGGVELWEATTDRLHTFLGKEAATRPGQAKHARVVLLGAFSLAVQRGAVAVNPVTGARLPAGEKAEPRALTIEEVHRLRAGVRAYVSDPDQVGHPRPKDLPAIIDVMLGTGARIGEVLALRWSDIDLGATPVRITINGTVVQLAGGVMRQGVPKTSSSFRVVTVPGFVADALLARSVEEWPNDGDLVFPSSTGTLRWTNNVQRQWRAARASKHLDGLDWVNLHALRKTVATLVERSSTVHDAAALLGHSSPAITGRVYVERASVAPDVSAALEALGG